MIVQDGRSGRSERFSPALATTGIIHITSGPGRPPEDLAPPLGGDSYEFCYPKLRYCPAQVPFTVTCSQSINLCNHLLLIYATILLGSKVYPDLQLIWLEP